MASARETLRTLRSFRMSRPRNQRRVASSAEHQQVSPHAAVGAIAPRGDSYLVLELQGMGDDAEASGREFMEKEEIEPSEISAPEIAGLKAFRAVASVRMPEGAREVEFTWIPYGGRVFRFRGVGPSDRFRSYAGIFRSAVRSVVLDVLSSRVRDDGSPGLFHPDRMSFGEPLYLSAVYAAVQSVPGVGMVTVMCFQRQGLDDSTAMENGFINIGPLEIARLDNDPNNTDHGVLRLTMRGGI